MVVLYELLLCLNGYIELKGINNNCLFSINCILFLIQTRKMLPLDILLHCLEFLNISELLGYHNYVQNLNNEFWFRIWFDRFCDFNQHTMTKNFYNCNCDYMSLIMQTIDYLFCFQQLMYPSMLFEEQGTIHKLNLIEKSIESRLIKVASTNDTKFTSIRNRIKNNKSQQRIRFPKLLRFFVKHFVPPTEDWYNENIFEDKSLAKSTPLHHSRNCFMRMGGGMNEQFKIKICKPLPLETITRTNNFNNENLFVYFEDWIPFITYSFDGQEEICLLIHSNPNNPQLYGKIAAYDFEKQKLMSNYTNNFLELVKKFEQQINHFSSDCVV